METLLNLISELSKDLGEKITIRTLSIKSKIPYTTTLRKINKNPELFQINKISNQKIISLNLQNPILKNYLAISEQNKTKIFLNKNKKISILRKQLPKGNYSLILFGSRANEKNRKQSDIDILILSNEKMNEKINFQKTQLLLNLEINPIFMLEKEFKKMLKEKDENLSKQILKNHIILKDENKFWETILYE